MSDSFITTLLKWKLTANILPYASMQYKKKLVQNGHRQKDRKLAFRTNYRFM